MEQPVLNEQDRRWVDAVVKMTAMTYDGRLKWMRVAVNDSQFIVNEAYGTSLTHTLPSQTFTLVVNTWKDSRKREVKLIASQNSITVKTLDNLTIVQALADAVLSKTENREHEREEISLQAIERA